ncbi:MAG: hypothetical protein A2033_04055 [Bacteroidetes bacterium GWA2_31_9]|nr:MAG: hypothetical protein A2033_04055 [Bacteroidetes bacterium GWA2_31_9]
MYPTISDLLNDLFGINIPMPIQSFGFFVAVAFLTVSFVLSREIKRYLALGIIPESSRKVTKGAPLKIQDYAISSAIGFVIFYKLVEAFINYSSFVENPQEFILSLQGSFIGGLLGAGIAIYLKYSDNQKEVKKYGKSKEIEETIQPTQITANILVLGAVFGLLGAKIFDNLENIDSFMKDPIGSLLSFSGLTFYGGFIFAAIAIIWYAKTLKIKALRICDIAAPALALGYGIGRIGCQVAGDGDWGIVNNLPMPQIISFLPDWFWSYNFPHNVINEGVLIEGCTGKHCFVLPEGVYPTALWEAILGISMFLILWIVRKKVNIAGMIFSIYMIMQGVERFFIEKVRVNSVYHIFGSEITKAEIISFFSILIGIAGVVYLLKNKAKYIKY